MYWGGPVSEERSGLLPPEADHVLILVNPTAGRGSAAGQVEALVASLRSRRFGVESFCDLEEACERANCAHRSGTLRALVGVGGDGTAAELVNRTDLGLPICMCPAGTSNVLARCLGLPASPHHVCEAIADGSILKMDAGSANGRIFLLMAGCGFDAHVVAEAHRLRQQVGVGRYSYWTYVKPILNAIRSYQYPEIRVYWDNAVADPESEATGTGTVRWVFACNLPLYGWGLPLAREADATDGVLDVRAFRHGSLWHGLRYLAAAQFGWQRRLPDCVVARATTLQVTAEQPVPYQLDGDPGGWLPLDIEVLAKRLTLVVPRGLRVHA
jgi:diacylglycerol kinase family enzyme